MTKILKVSTQGGTKTAKVRPKEQSCTVGHQNNKSININKNKNNKSDNAGQNPANLMKFKLKNSKITFLHQRKNLLNRATIFLRKVMILKQNQAISTKTPTKKHMCMFFLQITKPHKKGTIFTKTKNFEHPVKQVQEKRSQISRHKTFKAK